MDLFIREEQTKKRQKKKVFHRELPTLACKISTQLFLSLAIYLKYAYF